MANHISEAYKNYVIPQGHHRYQAESSMAMKTMCAYPPSQHAFLH